MIDIKTLTELDLPRFHGISRGYISPAVYKVTKNECDSHTSISLTLHDFESPYTKEWCFKEDDDRRYEQVVKQGLSAGVYDGNMLVGIAIAEKQDWNQTLWIWEFHIDVRYRRRKLGSRLMEHMVAIAKRFGCRVIVCETQNTNVPAIRFYRKVGYEIGAIDLSYYTNSDITDFEVAVFMKRFIE